MHQRLQPTIRPGWILLLILNTCGGGNPYGYAREYEPLSDEEDLYEKAEMASYEDIRRDPDSYKDRLIGWFGIVKDIKIEPSNNTARVALSLRFHQQRHLCSDQFDSSCRVTISERSGGPFSVLLTLRDEDLKGKDRVYLGSLLKIYGTPNGDYDKNGGPIIHTVFYRHWPRNTYVSTASKGTMRR